MAETTLPRRRCPDRHNGCIRGAGFSVIYDMVFRGSQELPTLLAKLREKTRRVYARDDQICSTLPRRSPVAYFVV